MDLRGALGELLERHSKDTPPDYFGFYSGVHSILECGISPRKFCECFAAELKNYHDQLRQYSERDEKDQKLSQSELDAFKAVFHKYKPLNGCAEKLPPEMRKLISELAGCPVMGI